MNSPSMKCRKGFLILSIAVVGVCMASNRANAAWFAKFDGVDGASIDEGYEGQIRIESFSWGVNNQEPSGAGSTRKRHHDFSFVKLIDKASPVLMKLSCAGDHIPEVTMTLTRPTGDKVEPYLVITLEDCFITSYSIGGSESGESLPLEEVSVSFSEVRYDCYCQTEAGQACKVTTECVSEPPTK